MTELASKLTEWFCDASGIDMTVPGAKFYRCAEPPNHLGPHRFGELTWTSDDPRTKRGHRAAGRVS